MQRPLVDSIHPLLEKKRVLPLFLIIDGPAGAGKTTLATELIEHFGFGEVIHCDDLYNGWDDALTPTLEQTIENWIIKPLKEMRPLHLRKYDWHRNSYGDIYTLPTTRLIILEGVGSGVRLATECADLSVWIDIPFEIGLQRVLERDGLEIKEQMLLWSSRQRDFFALHNNRENCSIHLPYGAPARP